MLLWCCESRTCSSSSTVLWCLSRSCGQRVFYCTVLWDEAAKSLRHKSWTRVEAWQRFARRKCATWADGRGAGDEMAGFSFDLEDRMPDGVVAPRPCTLEVFKLHWDDLKRESRCRRRCLRAVSFLFSLVSPDALLRQNGLHCTGSTIFRVYFPTIQSIGSLCTPK